MGAGNIQILLQRKAGAFLYTLSQFSEAVSVQMKYTAILIKLFAIYGRLNLSCNEQDIPLGCCANLNMWMRVPVLPASNIIP